MEEKNILTPSQKAILKLLADREAGNNPEMSINQILAALELSHSTVVYGVNSMKIKGLLVSRRAGREKRYRLIQNDLPKQSKGLLLELIYKYHLDKLEVKILLEAKKGERPKELARRLNTLEMQVRDRMETSIPRKFIEFGGFKAATFDEAKAIFDKEAGRVST